MTDTDRLPASEATARASVHRRPAAVRFAEAYALVFAIILLVLLFTALNPNFFRLTTFTTILGTYYVVTVLTLGLIIPLTAGDYDLSVASVLTLSAMTTAVLNGQHDWPLWAAVLAALSTGVVTGLVNAGFILYFRIPSLIVTLGTASFIQGVVLWMSGSMTVSGLDPLLSTLVYTRIFRIPLAFYYSLILCLALWYFFGYTTAGRRLLFVGRGREVARLSGIKVDRVRLGCLVASGLFSAFAGLLYAGTQGSADPVSGPQQLLPAFAAAFLGATAISPGRFNPWGSFVAVYFLATGITGLTMFGIQTFVQNLFYGGGLVLAVALSQLVRNREAQDFS